MNPDTLALDTEVLDLPLSAVPMRMSNALYRNNVRTVADIVSLSQTEILRMRGVGPESVAKLIAFLAEHDLVLAPEQPGVPWKKRALPPILADLEEAKWIGKQLDTIAEDERAQPSRGLFGKSMEATQVERRRYAWRMYRWVTGRTDKWPDMSRTGAAFDVYALPGSVEAQLAGLNRLAHEELGDE